MKSDKKKHNSFFGKFDTLLCFCVFSAIIIGFLAIISATKSLGSFRYIIVQGGSVLIGTAIIIVGMYINLTSANRIAPFLIGFNVLILILVLIIGQGDEVGTRGWIRFGFIGIQPAEIVKVTFIFVFAWHINCVKEKINEPKTLLLLLLHAGANIFLILLQPDYGTAMVFVTITVIMLFIAKISWKYILGAIGAFAVFAPIFWFFILKDYQKDRFFAFLNPEADPLGAGYHVSQSKIAIGSGKIWGNGLFSGIQTQLGHLPEKQTDFVFAVIGEEMGFVGCIIVFAILITIILKCFKIASNCENLQNQLICSGVGAMFLFHTFENIGMCIGLTPVTGIPLPFLSYGGSSMLTSLIAMMLVLNINNENKNNVLSNKK